mgnify:CR=1 FL=1
MIDIVVVPTISNCYRLDVTYNGKHASKLRGNDKKTAENFSAKLDIGLNFVTKDECKFFLISVIFPKRKLIIC